MIQTAGTDSQFKGLFSFDKIGSSKRMEPVHALMEVACQIPDPVLIEGEPGTGKEFAGRAIHDAGAQKNHPFIKLNCGSFSGDLLDDELYGRTKSRAGEEKTGLVEKVRQGTLFLDEITAISLAQQAKLLSLLQNKEFEKPGSNQKVQGDFRLIAATDQDLDAAVLNKKIREDFYYFVNVIRISLPPLRERADDIPDFAHHFIRQFNQKHQREIKTISDEALSALRYHYWVGNIHELENVIYRACILCPADTLTSEVLEKIGFTPRTQNVQTVFRGVYPKPFFEGGDLLKAVAELEKHMITVALHRSGGKQRQASRLLGITERMLGYKLKRYGYK